MIRLVTSVKTFQAFHLNSVTVEDRRQICQMRGAITMASLEITRLKTSADETGDWMCLLMP